MLVFIISRSKLIPVDKINGFFVSPHFLISEMFVKSQEAIFNAAIVIVDSVISSKATSSKGVIITAIPISSANLQHSANCSIDK